MPGGALDDVFLSRWYSRDVDAGDWSEDDEFSDDYLDDDFDGDEYGEDELGEDEGYPESVSTIVRDHEKIGRNDPCPCGSGKKYKKCCYGKDKTAADASQPRATGQGIGGMGLRQQQFPIGTVAFYGPDGHERSDYRVVGYLKADAFAARARAALQPPP